MLTLAGGAVVVLVPILGVAVLMAVRVAVLVLMLAGGAVVMLVVLSMVVVVCRPGGRAAGIRTAVPHGRWSVHMGDRAWSARG